MVGNKQIRRIFHVRCKTIRQYAISEPFNPARQVSTRIIYSVPGGLSGPDSCWCQRSSICPASHPAGGWAQHDGVAFGDNGELLTGLQVHLLTNRLGMESWNLLDRVTEEVMFFSCEMPIDRQFVKYSTLGLGIMRTFLR